MSTRGGVGITTVLLVVFVVLKLTDNIDWSWLWVLSPLWIPAALAAIIVLPFLIVRAVASIADTVKRNRTLSRQARDTGKP